MGKYEMIREIFNKCSGNQMRDVFFDEVETDDPVGYVRESCEDRSAKIECTEENGDVIVTVEAPGLKQRFSFTEI
ncbi:MAG: hypothetical protein RSB78_03145 [Oscillospiraceae bacterium]